MRGVRLGRTEMSKRELGRVEVLARVKSRELRLVDAAVLLRLSYRQTKSVSRRMEAVPGGRGRGAEASQRGAAVEPSVRGEVPVEGVGAGAREIRRAGGGVLRSHPGGGASGGGGPAGARCRDAAALDAGSRIMEPGAEEEATPAKARAEGALWGDGAGGRELSPLAGGAGAARVLDGPGRSVS